MNRINPHHRFSLTTIPAFLALALLATLAFMPPASAQTTTGEPSILAATFEAHGGLDHFRTFGTFSYTMNGFPLSGPMSKPNRSTVDLKTRRNLIEGDGFTVGWDGTQAWSVPGPDAVGLPPRFVTLGSFYFIGMPFVFGDDGVVLTDQGTGQFRGKEYQLISVGYKTGIGHTDEDEYAVFIDPDTHRIALIHHSVTENPDVDRVTWTFDEWQDLEGLLVPAKMTFYVGWNPEDPGEGASFTIEDARLLTSTPDGAKYEAPDDAVIGDGSNTD